MMPPKERSITPPTGGWREETYYLVKVAFSRHNPIHVAIFYSGFLDDKGEPSGYSGVWCSNYEETYSHRSLHYLEVLKEIHSTQEDDLK